jgi:hypothetical protein
VQGAGSTSFYGLNVTTLFMDAQSLLAAMPSEVPQQLEDTAKRESVAVSGSLGVSAG